MPTDLKWIERARRIGWEGTAMLRKFHGSDLPQSVQQAIAAELATVAAEVRAEKDAEWKGLMDDQVAVTEDLRAQLAAENAELKQELGQERADLLERLKEVGHLLIQRDVLTANRDALAERIGEAATEVFWRNRYASLETLRPMIRAIVERAAKGD